MAVAVTPALMHDVFRSYIRSPDPDIIFAYQALALNDGERSINAEHTGYVYFVVLAWTLRAARALGLITADRIGPMIGLDAASFDISYAQVIFTGRILSMVEVTALVFLVFWGVRFMTGALIPAAIASLLTAGSFGIALQASLLRSEPLSAFFVYAAFVSLCVAARRPSSMNALWMAICGACAALAMASKVQAIFPLLAIPALMVIMGTRPPPDKPIQGPNERWLILMLFMLLTAIATVPAAIMLVSGIVERGSGGLYQTALLLYLVAALVLYRWLYPMATARWLLGSTALALGVSLGLLVHLLYPNPPATDAIATFIEQMKTYSHTPIATSEGVGIMAMIEFARGTALQTLSRRLSLTPMVVLEVAIIVGSALCWRLQGRKTAVAALAMLVTVLGLETIFSFRALHTEYLVYTDPWRATAIALVFHCLATRFMPERRQVFAAVAVIAVIAIDANHMSRALRPDFIRYQPPEDACGQAKGYLPKLTPQFAKFCT